MSQINQVKIEGYVAQINLFNEDEKKTPLCLFRLGNKRREDTEWFTIKLWGQAAIDAEKNLHSGDVVEVGGQICQSTREKEDGSKYNDMFIRAEYCKQISNGKRQKGFIPAVQVKGEDIPF